MWALAFARYLAGRRIIPYDSVEEFYPLAFFTAQSIRHGEWPWWNPYLYSGYPQAADPQGLVFSPVLGLLMLLRDRPGIVWFDACVLACVLLGGFGMVAFMRRRGVAAPAGVLAAFVFILGGVASARLQHTPIVLAYSTMPWVLHGLDRMLDRPAPGRAMALGLAAGIMLTHLVQVSYLALLLFALYAGFELVRRGLLLTAGAWVRIVAATLFAAVVAACVAGPQLAATLAFLPLSTRQAFALNAVAVNSLPVHVLWTLLWPNVFGSLAGTYAGPGDITESFLFIGTVPLAVLVLHAWRRPGDPLARGMCLFFGAVLALSFLYLLGTHTPFFGALYRLLPGMDLFRRPADSAFVFNLALAVLVGVAADRVARLPDGPRLHRAVLVVIAVVALWHFAIAALEFAHGRRALAIAGVGIAALVSAGVIATRRAGRERAIAVATLALLCVADALVFNVSNRMNGTGLDALHDVGPDGVIMRALREDMAMARTGLPFRVEPTSSRTALGTNASLLPGLYSTQGYSPMRVRAYDDFFGAQESGNERRRFTPALPSLDAPLFDVGGARYVVTARPLPELAGSGAESRFERVATQGDTVLWRNPRAYPRMLSPHEALVIPWARASTAPEFGSLDFERTLLLHPETEADAFDAREAVARCTGVARWQNVHYANTRVLFDATAHRAAWVVLNDVWLPGWRAFADDEPIALWRANGPFRAVCVPPGTHHMRIEFTLAGFIREALLAGYLSR